MTSTNLTKEDLNCLIELVEMEHLISLCENNQAYWSKLHLKLKFIKSNETESKREKLETSYRIQIDKA